MPLSYYQKDCLLCGATFYKPYTCSKKVWEENRRFCSQKCGNEFFAEEKTERLKKFRFKKGHNPGIIGNAGKRGKDNGSWKETPSYNTLHRWLIDNYKKTGFCENCGAGEKTTHWARVSKTYTRNIKDYRELCPTCHTRYDRGMIELDCL